MPFRVCASCGDGRAWDTAQATGRVIVSHSAREFRNVDGPRVEDGLRASNSVVLESNRAVTLLGIPAG